MTVKKNLELEKKREEERERKKRLRRAMAYKELEFVGRSLREISNGRITSS